MDLGEAEKINLTGSDIGRDDEIGQGASKTIFQIGAWHLVDKETTYKIKMTL